MRKNRKNKKKKMRKGSTFKTTWEKIEFPFPKLCNMTMQKFEKEGKEYMILFGGADQMKGKEK